MITTPAQEGKQTFIKHVIVCMFSILLVLAIAMSPGIKSAGQLPVLILFFWSLFFCFRKNTLDKKDYALIAALSFMLISAVPQAIISEQGQPLDGPSRYLIAAIIYIALSHLKTPPLLIVYGAIGSAGITVAAGSYEILNTNHGRLDLGIGIIESGTVLSMILFILLPFFTVFPQKKVKAIFILAILICITFMILTGARGSWLAAVVSAVVFIFLKFQKNRFLIFFSLILSILIIGTAVYHSSERFSQRVDASIIEIQSLHDTNIVTSTNLRLLMWNHAWEGFKKNPLTGISYAENARLKRQFIKESNTSEVYSADDRGSAHNEMLTSMLYKGIIGLIALLCLYFVPLSFFIKYVQSESPATQALAISGTCCVTSAFISGLTEAPLMHTSVATTFAMIIILIANGIKQIEINSKPEKHTSKSPL
jgi:O-antigen ligase